MQTLNIQHIKKYLKKNKKKCPMLYNIVKLIYTFASFYNNKDIIDRFN